MNDSMILEKKVNGIKYFSAYFSCPVCIERGTVYPPSFWVHSCCPNDHLYIGANATLYCSGCCKTMKVMEAQYACPHHSNEAEEYVGIGDPLTLAEAMSSALALTRRAGREWVTRFLQAL